jgi:uncharacterized protein (TIGR02145 family)
MRKSTFIFAALFLAFFLISCAPEAKEYSFIAKMDPNFVNAGCVNPSFYDEFNSVPIGSQTWMAENLNYAACGSKCYNNLDSLCNIYGRLYDWATAMNLPASCNSSVCSGQIQPKHRGICPEGWHIPSNAEWDVLLRSVDGTTGTLSPYNSPTAGKHLKTADYTISWGIGAIGLDTYGFAALAGDHGEPGEPDVYFGSYLQERGYWWSASESNNRFAYSRFMTASDNVYYGDNEKNFLYSVRCVRD